MIKLTDILHESFKDTVFNLVDTSIKNYYEKMDRKYDGISFFHKAKTNPNFVVLMTSQMGNTHSGKANKCETNTFEYVKSKIESGEGDRYFPVGGFMITHGGSTIEHWWIYDKLKDKHFETCPFDPSEEFAYVGVINFDIQDEISDANYVFDVDFFKGGNVYSYYFK